MPVLGSTAYPVAREVTGLVRSLLNDANLAANAPIFIVSISRNTGTGVVTVTTQGPHGLVAGPIADQVQIAGVPTGASVFNGTFNVATVIGPTQFTYAQAGANDTQAAGTSSGIGLGAVWTDAILMPYLNSAYRKARRAVTNVGKPTLVRDNVLLVVPQVAQVDSSVQVSITDSTAPPNQLPSDLIEPLKIEERPNGSAQDFVEMADMTGNGGLPSQAQQQTLDVWEWRGDGLWFIGATQDTQIRLRYRAGFAPLTDGTSAILIRDSQDALALLAAGMIGKARGNPLADGWIEGGTDALEDLINDAARQMQRKGKRRRPFSTRSGWSPF